MAKKKTKKKRLSTKQKMWVEFYLSNGFNGSLAARQAGYKKITSGYENLQKPYIEEYIQERLTEAAMSADEVLARITAMAKSFDIADYITLVPIYAFDKEGDSFLAGHEIVVDFIKLQEDGYSHLIKGIRATANGIIPVWQDPLASLTLLAKHHKLLPDKLDLGGELKVKTSTAEAVDVLQKARKKLKTK